MASSRMSGRYSSSSAPSWQSRGGGRGRGRGGREGSSRNSAGTDLSAVEPMGKLLHTIFPEQIDTTISQDVTPTIEQCEYIASYNWLDGKASTILVPGSPPEWTPPSRAARLDEDDRNGIYYRDMNAARFPSYPVEPAIRALLKIRPDFDSITVDIVGCGNTFGSLLSACRLHDERTFNFGVERVGSTIFLVRQTPPGELIENVRGYGHSFPDVYSTWPRDVKGSASHQRLIQYNFAGLRCVVRSETDGYLPDRLPIVHDSSVLKRDEKTLDDAINSLTVVHAVKAASSKLSVQSAGQLIPQEAIFDLKTRSTRREVDMDEFLPRLWVNQTPNFVIARHTSGRFEQKDIEIRNVKPDVRRWQSRNQAVLLRLKSVLKKLIEITSQKGNTRVQVCRVGIGPLQITKPTKEWTVLPSELKARWEEKEVSNEQKAGESDSGEENADYLKF